MFADASRVPESGSPPALHYCIMAILLLQLQKNPFLYGEAEGLVAEL